MNINTEMLSESNNNNNKNQYFIKKYEKFFKFSVNGFFKNFSSNFINNNKFPLISFVILIYLNLLEKSYGFNLENRLPIIKQNDPGTYFGYSIAEHIIDYDQSSWILVGAPLAQNLQPGTNRSGALFKCPLTNKYNDCTQIPTDGIKVYGSDELMEPSEKEIKNGQWLGVSVKSQGTSDGKAFVCAHRNMEKVSNNLNAPQISLGFCYVLDNNLTYDQCIEPCRGRSIELMHEEYAFCQAGTSSAFLSDGTMVLGTPGLYNWRGTLFAVQVTGDFLDRDKLVYYGPHTDAVSPVKKDSLLGMSVTGGRYFNDKMSYAAGAPHSEGVGQVIIFTKSKPPPINITMIINGEQFGSGFGYEMITADVNGDGLDDLIIAAPFYFSRHEGGAVYIYQNSDNTLPKNYTQKLTGKVESRFGFALANIGDINKDYYDDIAIGAPFEDSGVVYIYLGSQNGLPKIPSQIISGSDIRMMPPLKTFGSSLSGGVDLDKNEYPDLAIGAYDSSAVTILLSRPIIKTETKYRIKFSSTDDKNIDPKTTGCLMDSRSNLTCFSFEACCKIYRISANESIRSYSLIYSVEAETFDNLKKLSRVFFKKDYENRSSLIEHNIKVRADESWYCENEIVYLKEKTRDIQNSIKIRFNYTIIEPPLPPKALIEDLHPILDQTKAFQIFEVPFLKDCGIDEVCESQLDLFASILELTNDTEGSYNLMIGKSDSIQLFINVNNSKESAYDSQLFIEHDQFVSYAHVNSTDIVSCNTYNDTILNCALGNPMPSNSSIKLLIKFDLQKLEGRDILTSKNIFFKIKVNSTSKQLIPRNDKILMVNVIKKSVLSITGKAIPEQSFYSKDKDVELKEKENKIKYLEDIGNPIEHIYEIYNDGPYKAADIRINVNWPLMYKYNNIGNEMWLLYLHKEPFIETKDGIVDCTIESRYVNPWKLSTKHIELLSEPMQQQFIINSTNQYPSKTLNKTESEEKYTYSSSSYESSSKYSSKLNRVRRSESFDLLRPENLTDNSKKLEIVNLNCETENVICISFYCTIDRLEKKRSVTLKINGFLDDSTLSKHFSRVNFVAIQSKAIISMPTSNIYQVEYQSSKKVVETLAQLDLSDQPIDDHVSIWIYIVAIIGGLLLLALVCYCLYRFGFFKRKRPDPTLSGNLEKNEPLLR